MRIPVAPATIVAAACALAPATPDAPAGPTPASVPVWVRSQNRSVVDVYLLCGDRNARRLGEVSERTADLLEIPAGQEYCPRGLNFFLVVRKSGWGYWVGPFQPAASGHVELVIEKYAGLSSARVLR